MTREMPHEKFPAQVLMDLAATRPFRTHGNVCFDKKLKQNAFNNFMLSHTPYRCSLGKPKATEAKTRRRAKRANEVRNTTEDASSTYISLPKIPPPSESMIRGRNGSSKYSKRLGAEHDLIELESDDEKRCDFLSCGSVKIEGQSRDAILSPRPQIRECTRSRSLPLILNRGNSSSCLKCNNRACKFRLQSRESYPARKMDSSNLSYLEKHSASNDQEFTKVMDDGARVTVKQQRLSIEIFMPRTS